jgi:hypothetical protein
LWGVYRNEELIAGIGLVGLKPLSLMRIMGYQPRTPYGSISMKPCASEKEEKCNAYRISVLDLIAGALEKEADVVRITGDPDLTDIRPFCWRGWASDVKFTYLLDIGDPSRLWDEQLHSGIRNHVRQCRKKGITVTRVTDTGMLYEIERRTLERQGRNVPLDETSFNKLCDELMRHGRLDIFAAYANGQAISAIGMIKDYHSVAHYWAVGTDPDYLKLGAASFTLWTAIEELASEGFNSLDLIGANIHSIARFKSQFGPQLKPYYQIARRNAKARVFDWCRERALGWGIADWLKANVLYHRGWPANDLRTREPTARRATRRTGDYGSSAV